MYPTPAQAVSVMTDTALTPTPTHHPCATVKQLTAQIAALKQTTADDFSLTIYWQLRVNALDAALSKAQRHVAAAERLTDSYIDELQACMHANARKRRQLKRLAAVIARDRNEMRLAATAAHDRPWWRRLLVRSLQRLLEIVQ